MPSANKPSPEPIWNKVYVGVYRRRTIAGWSFGIQSICDYQKHGTILERPYLTRVHRYSQCHNDKNIYIRYIKKGLVWRHIQHWLIPISYIDIMLHVTALMSGYDRSQSKYKLLQIKKITYTHISPQMIALAEDTDRVSVNLIRGADWLYRCRLTTIHTTIIKLGWSHD